MERVVCCYNTRGVIFYIKRHYPELLVKLYDDLDPVFDTVDDVEAFLLDEHNWISQKVCAKLFERVRIHSGDNEIARDIGRESIRYRSFGYLENIFIKAIGHPFLSIRRASAINAKFNKTKVVEIVESDWSHAIVRLKWFGNLGSTRDICLYNLGIYESIPTIWGLPMGTIHEYKCYFNGDDCCEFRLEWAKKSFFAIIYDLFTRRNEVLQESLAELEREKALSERKYLEIQHLNIELKKKVERLTSLNTSTKATTSILDIDKLLFVITSLITNIMHFDRAIILLLDEKERCLRPVKLVGSPEQDLERIQGYTIPIDRTQNILARVVDSGVAQIVTDVEHSFLRKENIILKEFKPKSFVAVPLITHTRVIGVLAAERIEGLKDFSSDDLEYLMNFCSQIAISIENAKLMDNLQQSYMSSILSLASALEAKDTYTRGHSNRVAIYSTMIAQQLGLTEDQIEKIRLMALMHDIGKIGIPDSIINKRGKLTEGEFSLVKRHPNVGIKIIEPLLEHNPDLSLLKSHHERYDGSGYPEGLSGTDIPLEARILGVTDTFDAMTSNRPYRTALSVEIALTELETHKGKQFCPEIVPIFTKIIISMSDKHFKCIQDEFLEPIDIENSLSIISNLGKKQAEAH